MRFTIDGPPLSLNQFGKGRNWRVRAAVTKRLRAKLGWEVRAAIGISDFPVLKTKMRLRVKVYHKTRRLDPDNVIGGLKPLIDAMRDVGVVWRDSPKWLVIEPPEQFVDKARPRTVVEIEPFLIP